MKMQAASIGEAVPRGNFDAAIQSVFDSAVNLKLAREGGLITVLISKSYELPQGIRITDKNLPLHSLTVNLRAALRGGVLRFDSSPLSIDLRGASVWRCRVKELNADMESPFAVEAWSKVWELLNETQRSRSVDLVADDLLQADSGSSLSRKLRHPIAQLASAARQFNVDAATCAAEKMIGLGPGITPSGDDILIGFFAAMWSMAGNNEQQLSFIHSFGDALMQVAKRTNEISRTYLYHAIHGEFSSSLSNLAEAFATSGDVLEAARYAMCVGHSSGMDSVTGMLLGLRVWTIEQPYA